MMLHEAVSKSLEYCAVKPYYSNPRLMKRRDAKLLVSNGREAWLEWLDSGGYIEGSMKTIMFYSHRIDGYNDWVPREQVCRTGDSDAR